MLRTRYPRSLMPALLILVAALLVAAPAGAKGLAQMNLLSDISGLAAFTDANVVNSWGIAFGPTGLLWVADNGTGVATVYFPNGEATGLVVTIPPPAGGAPPATPTGIIRNATGDFVVTENAKSGPARFIFATEDGTISGWNPTVNATNAILAADRSGTGAVYKGIAMAVSGGHNFLYATNFHAGVVDVFDAEFQYVTSFTDSAIEEGFAPFGIRTIGNRLVVTYAVQNDEKHDDVAGPGNGFVVVFDPDGSVVKELISHGRLNSPWGLAIAPGGLGMLTGTLLVGNFGNGRINAYDPMTGAFVAPVVNRRGNAIEIEGLWGLEFFHRPLRIGADQTLERVEGFPLLYFASGPNDEGDGLVGTLRQALARGRFGGIVR